jgi:hypothetical protein
MLRRLLRLIAGIGLTLSMLLCGSVVYFGWRSYRVEDMLVTARRDQGQWWVRSKAGRIEVCATSEWPVNERLQHLTCRQGWRDRQRDLRFEGPRYHWEHFGVQYTKGDGCVEARGKELFILPGQIDSNSLLYWSGFPNHDEFGRPIWSMESSPLPAWQLSFPGGIAALMFGMPALLYVLARAQRLLIQSRRRRSGLCLHCGYDLRATSDRCPECGKSTQREN